MEVDQPVLLDEDEEQPAEGEFIARYKLTVEYVGPRYHGSQRQGNKGKTVQEELEVALGKLTHAPPPSTVFSGRTDAGVHAVGQVVHADLCRRSRRGQPLPPMEVPLLLNALNDLLPDSCGVVAARRVPDSFDARRSAVCRTYLYRIACAAAATPPSPDADSETRRVDVCPALMRRGWFSSLDKQRALCLNEPLDLARMRAAARALEGRHDFSAFRHVRCSAASAVRDLLELSVAEEAAAALDEFAPERPRRLVVRARARSFLKHQVRYLVATLLEAGRGRLDAAQVRELLEGRDNGRVPQPPAAAHGLYLARVEYPDSAYLQEQAEGGAQRGASGDDDEADDGSAGDCDG